MYVNPFILGILTVIFAEALALVILGTIKANNRGGKDGNKEN